MVIPEPKKKTQLLNLNPYKTQKPSKGIQMPSSYANDQKKKNRKKSLS